MLLCKTLITDIVTKSLPCTTDSVHNGVLLVLHINDPQQQQLCNILLFIQVVSGSHSKVQHTKTTVLWSWRTLVKVMMPCSAELTFSIVADLRILIPLGNLS